VYAQSGESHVTIITKSDYADVAKDSAEARSMKEPASKRFIAS